MCSVNTSKTYAPLMTEKEVCLFFFFFFFRFPSLFPVNSSLFLTDFRIAANVALVRKDTCAKI